VTRKNPSREHWTLNAMISARPGTPPVVYNIIKGATKQQEFFDFMTSPAVLATLQPGDHVVLDNCQTHHVEWVQDALEALYAGLGVDIWYLPPYCPFFNATELLFSFVKTYLHQKCSYADSADSVVLCARLALRMVNKRHIAAWFDHVLSL
jgi:transposase